MVEIMKEELSLLQYLIEILEHNEEHDPVLKPQEPKRLSEKINFSLPEEGEHGDKFKNNLINLVHETPRSSSRRFFNQLFGGRNNKAVLGDILSIILNTGMHTYKVNGPQILIEKEVIQALCKRIDFPDTAGGIFTPGGSIANLKALIMARDAKDSSIQTKGVRSNLCAYASNQSHYSLIKNMRFVGLGEHNLRLLESDNEGRLDATILRQAIERDLQEGNVPFFINANAGTTELGSFDTLPELVNIAQEYGLWLHVDGAVGGSTIMSDQYKYLLDGLKGADSFSINTHKMLRTPISTSIIIVRDRERLTRSFSYDANYLYQANHHELNPGMASIQCARKNDALKLWTLWKSIGRTGLEAMVNESFRLAQEVRKYCIDHPDYSVIGPSTSTSICFQYKNLNAQDLCRKLHEDGKVMVSHGRFKGQDFVRMVTINSNLSETDVLSIFEHIEEYA
jgi:sulfinoalanine decarboxylase/sulfinoalanine decarboxylase/aspartate 1-decarboxylase